MWRSMFMLRNGRKLHEARIDLRNAPPWRNGTRAIRFFSNQSIDLELASSFTLVGLTRVSIGPAIRVMLRGCAGFWLCAITATASSTATQGWQTASTWAPSPITSMNLIRCSTYSSKPNRPAARGTSRMLCQSVM
jgi:hypothetical protein